MNNTGNFVILYHYFAEENVQNGSSAHFDLLFEEGNDLRAWRIPADLSDDFAPIPGFLAHPAVEAEELPSHRRLYLRYEGEISGNRGFVRSWDKGEFRLIAETPDRLVIRLQSQNVKTIELTRHHLHRWKLQLISTEVIHD